MPTPVAVGTEIEAQCGRCHDATNHVILTMENDKPKRGRCLTCEAEHLYRKPKGPEEPRAKGTRKLKDDVPTIFANAMEAAGDVAAQPYKLSALYQAGQKLKHKAFGEGVVLEVPRPQVIEVVFSDKIRKLAQGR